jgi:hypothetical protein
MVDNLKAMASATDAEFTRLLGVDRDWTKFVADVLLSRGVRGDNAMFEDMVTDIVTNILMALQGENQLADKIAWCRATAHDEESLLDMLKPVMTAAVHLRFRDFRRRGSHNVGRHQIAEGANEPVASQHYIGSEMDADSLQGMIEAELSSRFDSAVGMQRSVLAKSLAMLPDRIEGMGIRAICEKHGWGRGKMVSMALKEIFAAVEAVATRLQEGWILTFISK